MSDQADNMAMAKVLTGVAFMIIAICVRKPLFSGTIGVSVVRLMEARLVYRIRHSFHAHEEQRGNKQLEDSVTHFRSLHNFLARIQLQFTVFEASGRET